MRREIVEALMQDAVDRDKRRLAELQSARLRRRAEQWDQFNRSLEAA